MNRDQKARDADLARRRELFQLTGKVITREDDPRPVDVDLDDRIAAYGSMTRAERDQLLDQLSRDPSPLLDAERQARRFITAVAEAEHEAGELQDQYDRTRREYFGEER